MADRVSAKTRSRIMSRIRGKNTTPEVYMFAAIRATGWSFRKHDRTLAGAPDLVFPRPRVAVFIDGDFWHGFRFPAWSECLTPPWREKIENNRKRDNRTRAKLRRQGWTVIRIWEHQVETDILACVRRIGEAAEFPPFDEARVKLRIERMPPLRRRRRLPRPKSKT